MKNIPKNKVCMREFQQCCSDHPFDVYIFCMPFDSSLNMYFTRVARCVTMVEEGLTSFINV